MDRKLTIPKDILETFNARSVVEFEFPQYATIKGDIVKCECDKLIQFTLLNTDGKDIICLQLFNLYENLTAKAIDEIIKNVMFDEPIAIIEKEFKYQHDIFEEEFKKGKMKNEYTDKFINSFRTPVRENISQLNDFVANNKTDMLDALIYKRLELFGKRGIKDIENLKFRERWIEELDKIKLKKEIEKKTGEKITKEYIDELEKSVAEYAKMAKLKSSEWRTREIKCECGCKFTQVNKARHERTSKKHLDYLKEKLAKEEWNDEDEYILKCA
jgi:hypothetical protein